MIGTSFPVSFPSVGDDGSATRPFRAFGDAAQEGLLLRRTPAALVAQGFDSVVGLVDAELALAHLHVGDVVVEGEYLGHAAYSPVWYAGASDFVLRLWAKSDLGLRFAKIASSFESSIRVAIAASSSSHALSGRVVDPYGTRPLTG
jgi:hypothetical protein